MTNLTFLASVTWLRARAIYSGQPRDYGMQFYAPTNSGGGAMLRNNNLRVLKPAGDRRLSSRWKLVLGLATVVLLCCGTAVAQTTYTVTDLGTLGRTFGVAADN